jgi:pimeloyl-ACP methyl ester carboxylesterase
VIRWALLLALLAGCPAFHAARPTASEDATFVEVDGISLHYKEMGQGETVVLIHGFGASLETWRGIDAVLAKHFRVIAIDLMGFGDSSRPAGDYSPVTQARLVWRALVPRYAVHALDRLLQERRVDVGAAGARDVGGALARHLDEAARQLVLVGQRVEVDLRRRQRPAGQRGGVDLDDWPEHHELEVGALLGDAGDELHVEPLVDDAEEPEPRPRDAALVLRVQRLLARPRDVRRT